MQQHSSYLYEIPSACFKSLKQWLPSPSLFYVVVSLSNVSIYLSWFRKQKCLLCLNHILKLSCCKICEVSRRLEIMLNMVSLVWPKRLQCFLTLEIRTVAAGKRKLQTNFCWAGSQVFVSKPLQNVSEKPFLSQCIGDRINFCCC